MQKQQKIYPDKFIRKVATKFPTDADLSNALKSELDFEVGQILMKKRKMQEKHADKLYREWLQIVTTYKSPSAIIQEIQK